MRPDRPAPETGFRSDKTAEKTFSKNERIRKRKDYLTIYQQGTRGYSEHFITITKKNPLGVQRLGITVSKKVGNAVKRNRIKRLLREFFRLNKSRLSNSQDILIMAKKGIPAFRYQDICKELEGILFKKADATE
jgi:ribonuclease P protein component